MFAKYTYKANTKLVNLQSDIDKILTGTTNVENLSSDCDYTNSSIISTIASDWVRNGRVVNLSYGAITLGNATGSSTSTNNDTFYSPTFKLFYPIAAYSGIAGFRIFPTYDATANNTVTISQGTTFYPLMADNGKTVVILLGSNAANSYPMYSIDGTTFIQNTTNWNGTKLQNWTAITTINSTYVAVASSGTTALYSTDSGINWNTSTIPSGNYQAIASNGTRVTAIGASGLCSYSDDQGQTWSQVGVTAPTGGTFLSVAWNGTLFCAIGINILATSPDGIVWTSTTMTNASGGKILWDSYSSMFFVMTGSASIAYSINGTTWTYNNAFGSTMTAVSNNGGYKAWAIGHFGRLQVFNLTSSTTINFFIFNSPVYKALNVDGSYKNISLEIQVGYIGLNTYESITNNIPVNPSANTINSGNDQVLNLTLGGVLYIMATKYYICILSYQNTSYGSQNNTCATGVFEYSRDDLWSITPYPTWGLSNGQLFLNLYVPRIKGDAVDQTNTNSVLSECPDFTISSKIIDAFGNQYDANREIRFCNSSSFNKLVLGGKLLGGIKRTTDNVYTNGDFLTFNSVEYMVLIGSNRRYLIPKQ